jgi:hypothetical protein
MQPDTADNDKKTAKTNHFAAVGESVSQLKHDI